MLSIGKLGRGQEGYYLQADARELHDDDLETGEAPGRCIGGDRGAVCLSGRVGADADAVQAVMTRVRQRG